MTRFLLTISVGALAIFFTSCGCCTSDSAAPPMRPLPTFKEIPTTPTPVQVEYSK